LLASDPNALAGEAARHLLAAIVETSDDAIVSKNLEGIIQSWNQGAERLFGYRAVEILGKSILLLTPPALEHEEQRILGRIRRGEKVDAYDTRRRRKDGSLVDVSVTVSPILDAEGRVVGASNIARDISERRRTEQALARHVAELAALYELTDRLQRSTDSEEVFAAALDAILRALHCRRASILLFDEAGVMRFVAWRGLSEDYRAATTGHSPWRPDSRDPEPIAMADVETAELDETLRQTIRAERIGALAFVPLVARGRVIGKFMVYYDAPHAFEPGELDLALSIARQLAFGLERLRAEEQRVRVEQDLRASEARERERAAELATIMESAPAAIWITRDRDARRIIGNAASYDLLRLPPAANASLSAEPPERPRHFECYGGGRRLELDELPVQRAARGEEVRDFEEEIRFADGSSRWLIGNARPLRDVEGRLAGAVAAFVDVTARKRAEAQRELLVGELNHRVKNTLATVISIARQSFTRSPETQAARRAFEERIRALAQTHSRLAESAWAGDSLEAMVAEALAPFRHERRGNVSLSGPAVTLSPKCAVALGMAFHELVTNAAKHGALSAEEGSVEVAWQVDSERQRLRIRWTESDGPQVAEPQRRGFGRFLLERALVADLDGGVRLEFPRTGLRCTIELPLGTECACA
jgi:PAS domain S-box-containing protein